MAVYCRRLVGQVGQVGQVGVLIGHSTGGKAPKLPQIFSVVICQAVRLCVVCVKYYKIYCLLNFAAYLVFIWCLN